MTSYPGHHSEFFARLYELQQNGLFTDIKVIAAGQRSFDCHKIVLSTMSPFIEAMLQANMMEQISGEISLAFDEETVESVLKYIYTGKNILTKSNVLPIYQAAHMLQIASLITMCEVFLKTDISVENCLGIWKISKLLGRSDMAGVAMVTVLQNFTKLCTAETFESADLDLEDLKKILSDRFLNSTPSAKCNAAVIWLMLLDDVEQETVYDLLKFLMTSCGLSTELLQRSLDIDNKDLWNNFPSCNETQTRRNTYQEVLHRLSVEGANISVEALQDRSDEAFIVIGGNDMKSKTFMMTLNLRDHKWYCLSSLPDDPGFHFAICCSGTCLYLTGGTKRGDQFLEYNIVENAWTRLTDIPVGREGHGMAGFDNAIYIFGGKTDPPSSASHVQMYIPEDRTWRKVGELAKPVYSPSSCVLQNKIYIFGGSMLGQTTPSDLAQCFDTGNNISWYLNYKLPFKSKSSSLLVVAGINKIYFIYKGVIYCLDPKEERVKRVLSLSPGPKIGAGATSYGDKILIIGGEDDNYRNLDTIILLDPSANQATPLPAKTPWYLTAYRWAKLKMPSALVHGLNEVKSSDGEIP